MATIKLNDHAPSEEATFLLANETLKSADLPKDTDNRALVAAAEEHPWLAVDYPEVESFEAAAAEPRVRYEDDYLAAPNSKAFDLDEVRKTEEAKRQAVSTPTAIDAGLDQSDSETVADVSVTLAADEAADTTTDAPKRKGAKS